MTIKVTIADDHTLLRDALAELIATEPDIEIVGVAGDAQSSVELARSTAADVMILDVDMPGPGAVPTVRTLRKVCPSTHLLMLSMYDDPALIRTLLGFGIRGYMLKSASHEELLAALRRIVVDPNYLVLSVTARLFDAAPAVPEESHLSDREKEILQLVSTGLSNAQIGRQLGLQESTVKRHMHNSFVKLGAASRIDAVNKAVSLGQISGRASERA